MQLEKHPRNQTDFVWQQPEPPYRIITEAQARDYREVGGFVLQDAFSSEDLAPVIAALDALEAEAQSLYKEIAKERVDDLSGKQRLLLIDQAPFLGLAAL